MKYWIVIKVFGLLYTDFGPYEDMKACQDRLVEMKTEGMSRYNAGERVYFMGKEVHPQYVNMSCKGKSA